MIFMKRDKGMVVYLGENGIGISLNKHKIHSLSILLLSGLSRHVKEMT